VAGNQFRLDTLAIKSAPFSGQRWLMRAPTRIVYLGIVFAAWSGLVASISRFLALSVDLLKSFNPKKGGTYVNNFDHHSHSVARRRITELAL
jgi:hypothetical protein